MEDVPVDPMAARLWLAQGAERDTAVQLLQKPEAGVLRRIRSTAHVGCLLEKTSVRIALESARPMSQLFIALGHCKAER